MCTSIHAGGFYKWKDEKGVTHITDHPPGIEADVEVDTGVRANRAPIGNSDSEFSQQIVDYHQEFEVKTKEMSEVDKVRAKQLDAEISSARSRYAEMNSDKYSARNIAMVSNSERQEILKKREEAKELVERLLSEQKNLFDKYNNEQAYAKSSTIESKVDGSFEGWDGETIVKLMNGQIWMQNEYHYHYHYAYMPDVLIYNSGGGWRMKIEGVDKSVGVQKLK